MVEQRRYKRAPIVVDVLVNGNILVKGTNVSEGGLYVHTGRNFALDSIVTVEFRVLDKNVSAKAQVKNCQPSVGMGLRFVELTLEQTQAIRQFVQGSLQAGQAPEKKKILLVDDNDTQRRINKSRLVHDGFTVYEAAGGVEAVRMLPEVAPDIVVLDLEMADMDGLKVLAYIRGDGALKAMPVLMLSARGTPADINRAMSAGADGYLVKMMTSPVKLSEQIKKLLGK